ncbi:mitochondrial arginine transporter BAC2-like [Nicotiana tabacum]|uniref:Mitochondrial arginine transporter BAC2-like n=1 Tax=Nicotiana tabacum TaxID=4097 RepID=A0A1S4CJC1_TOBAC|nr:PREDICTED: mitochondrial arginine transporter BAC2-like [Nicotiana tabacum]
MPWYFRAMQFYIGLTETSQPATHPRTKGWLWGGIGAGAIQSLIISPVELVKIRIQLQSKTHQQNKQTTSLKSPKDATRRRIKQEGWRGIYRGLTITVLRDSHSHGLYFWIYEYTKEQLQPCCHKNGQESFQTTLIAGAVSWISCYRLDVVKTRLQAQSHAKYSGIVDCFRRSDKEEGHAVLWRGLGTTVGRAFLLYGAIFTAYETALRYLFNKGDNYHANAQSGKAL